MSVQANVVVLAVKDVDRAKRFYVEGLGGRVTQDFPGFVRFTLGSSDMAVYEWDAAAAEAGVPAEGAGFRGVAFHYLPETRDEVDAAMRAAEAAGATVVRPAEAAEWGGYSGYFSDPDGYLWKVATDS